MDSDHTLPPLDDASRKSAPVFVDSQHTQGGNALTKERTLSNISTLESLLRYFSASERLALYVLTILFALSTLALLAGLNAAVSTVVPTRGGSLAEGEVGPARFINPILSMSQADQDISALVYSGLLRALPDGRLIPDLAASYTVSEDGTTYTFVIREDAQFHDGKPVTADDVIFTIQSAQNPEVKSPHRADWEGVTISAPDIRTIEFKLSHPYAPFIYNTTLGILPKHLWHTTPPEEFPFSRLNTHPIGSGPYQISNFTEDATGAATRYDLAPAKRFTLGGPNLKRISFVFFPSESDMIKAFNDGSIDAIAGLASANVPQITREDASIITAPLPRLFGVFFNQNHSPVLADASVRAALDAAIDKEALVQKVLGGYGVALRGPIPPGVLSVAANSTTTAPSQPTDIASSTARSDAARAILGQGGWKFDSSAGAWTKKNQPLTFTLATADEPELIATANSVARSWSDAGIPVNVQVYPIAELNTNVIRPRSYDAILFGEIVGREGDLFAFWHSSQRNDPGLNLAMYANSKADALLAQARATTDVEERQQLWRQFSDLVVEDHAAVFLYAPEFIYAAPEGVHGIELGALTAPAERFLNVYDWYTDTERVWDVFVNKTR